MPRTDAKEIHFPLLGLQKQYAFGRQPFYSSVDLKNVWPIDTPTSRLRGGRRPGTTMLGTIAGSVVYNASRGSYYSSGLKEGLFVTVSAGSYESLNGATWTQRISTAPGTALTYPKTASNTIYNGYIFQAKNNAASDVCRQKQLPSGAEADLSNAGGGTAPTGFGIVLAHGDALWGLNFLEEPSRIVRSAVGDHTNWDYTIPTSGAAYTNTGAEGGRPGFPLVAGLSHNHNVLLAGGPTGIASFRGNPHTGGMRVISEGNGPLMQTAWCKVVDSTYFVGPLGLYEIAPGEAATPRPVSKQIPNELIGLNPYDGDRVCVGYDSRWNFIFIGVDPTSGNESYWAYKLPEPDLQYPGGFFPLDFSDTFHLAAHFPEIQSDDLSSVLLVKGNATTYQFDRTSTEDFDSYAFIGPFRAGDLTHEGALQRFTVALAEDSDDLYYEIYAAESAEAAYQKADPPNFTNKSPDFTGSFNRIGWNEFDYPKIHGSWFYIRFMDNANEAWLFDEGVAEFISMGLRRSFA